MYSVFYYFFKKKKKKIHRNTYQSNIKSSLSVHDHLCAISIKNGVKTPIFLRIFK